MELVQSRLGSIFGKLKASSWILYGLFFFAFFSLGKIPETKIRAWVEGSINSVLVDKGMQLKVSESYLSTWAGLRFVMRNVFVNMPPPSAQLKIDEVVVSPAWLDLFSGKQGVNFTVKSMGGTLSGTFSGEMDKSVLKNFYVNLDISKWNLGKTGVLEILSGIRGSAIADGHVQMAGDATIPSTWKGDAKVNLQNISIDSQSIQPMPGFTLQLPEAKISVGEIDLLAASGGIQIRNISAGKPGSADDIILKMSGDMVLGRSLAASTIKASVNLSLAPAVLKSVGFLEMAMAQAKQSDGSYSYEMKGELLTPLFTPIPPR